eukprot:IDg21085t1
MVGRTRSLPAPSPGCGRDFAAATSNGQGVRVPESAGKNSGDVQKEWYPSQAISMRAVSYPTFLKLNTGRTRVQLWNACRDLHAVPYQYQYCTISVYTAAMKHPSFN